MHPSIHKQLAYTAKNRVTLYTDSKWTKIPSNNRKSHTAKIKSPFTHTQNEPKSRVIPFIDQFSKLFLIFPHKLNS
jgi:hypothetical protein